MKKTAFILMTVAALAAAAFAADTKTYVAKGKVLSSRPDVIRVSTAVQNMDIVRDKGTKVNGDVRKGCKVSVTYTNVAGNPHATQIDVIK